MNRHINIYLVRDTTSDKESRRERKRERERE